MCFARYLPRFLNTCEHDRTEEIVHNAKRIGYIAKTYDRMTGHLVLFTLFVTRCRRVV